MVYAEPEGTGTLEGLRILLERATGQMCEIGYTIGGDWTVN